MEQRELVPTGNGWITDDGSVPTAEELAAEDAARQAEAQHVDTATGEVAAETPAPGTAVALRSQANPAPMARHQAAMDSLETFDKDMAIAKALAMAGVFPNAQKDANKAYAAILIGRDLGMGPAEALMNVEFGAQGKPVISIHWQSAQIRRAGHDYRVVGLSPTGCMIHFFRRRNGHGVVKEGQVEIEKSELEKISIHDKNQGGNGRATLGGKWNYKSWGQDMMYAFCMRRGMRRFYPELLMGYGGSEADDVPEVEFVDDTGEAEPVGTEQAINNLYGDPAPTGGK